MTAVVDRERFSLRAPCAGCTSEVGYVLERNGQDTVRCVSCDRFQYNAPRTETGRAVRSVSTIHAAVRPKQRARIILRAGAKCETCGAAGRDGLHVGHIVSVEVGLNFGLSDDEINDDENLLALCAECNLGFGAEPMPLRVAISVLRARVAWARRNEGGQ